jgi:hypothetical protein
MQGSRRASGDAKEAPGSLNARQVAVLEALLRAGFRFVTIERVERYLAVEKHGFVALLDPSEGRLALFGQGGYRMAGGIGMLVERKQGKAFVWKRESLPATPELLAAYASFKDELARLLAVGSGEREAQGEKIESEA